MYVQNRSDCPTLRRAGALVIAALLSSCGTSLVPEAGENPRPTLPLSTIGFDPTSTYLENAANDLFERAEEVDLSGQARVIVGSITGTEDVDVYNLGPVSAGQHILATMETDSTLDGAIALFDERGTALLVDDHRNVYLGRAEPFIDVIVRRPSAACYLAVSAAHGYGADGSYTLTASKETGVAVPAPTPDTVLLVFHGGSNVRIGGRPTVDVPSFNAAGISPDYAGQSEAVMAQIVAKVREDYEGFEVTILSTSEGAAFEPDMSRVFFGTFDDALLGIAQGVDEFNSIKGQSAIVFTDTFEAFLILRPSVAQMSQAIANVASHEIGHLLGLVHSDDPEGIMDVTAGLSELLLDQVFRRSPIYVEVFPVGFQDEVQSLLDSVGGDPLLVGHEKPHTGREPVRARTKPHGLPARQSLPLSTCALCGLDRR